MKVAFIHPPSLLAADSYSTISTAPLGIAYLAAQARALGHDVCVVDAVGLDMQRLMPWPHRSKRLLHGLSVEETVGRVPADVDVIGVSSMFTHAWPLVRELMLALRQRFPRARIVAGGEHVTALPELVLRQSGCDACVLGEGEATLGELLDGFADGTKRLDHVAGIVYLDHDGQVVKTPSRQRLPNPDSLPPPAWDLLDPTAYMSGSVYIGPGGGRTMPMLATRGCPYRCTFCSSPNMWTQNWKVRSPAAVVDEMEAYMGAYSATDFQFQDLTAIVRKDWILAFCREILTRRLRLTWTLPFGTRSEAVDAEVAEALVASGCHHITYAPESGSERILKAIEKKVNLGRLEQSIRCALAAGMKVCLFMIVGFPQESEDDIQKTLGWIRRMARMGVHEVSVNTFVPLPGTQLFDEVAARDHIEIDDDFLYAMTGTTSLLTVRSWNQRLSGQQLQALKLWALCQFYALSFACHPGHLLRLLANLLRGRQETKVDRLIAEMMSKLRALGATYVSRIPTNR